jgi:hypothetical protein
MKFMPSKLFHAVVVTGAALTGCAGSDDVTDEGLPRDEAAAVADTQTDAEAPPADAVDLAAGAGVETTGTGTCPPGSERPFPPCFWIL